MKRIVPAENRILERKRESNGHEKPEKAPDHDIRVDGGALRAPRRPATPSFGTSSGRGHPKSPGASRPKRRILVDSPTSLHERDSDHSAPLCTVGALELEESSGSHP